MKRYLIRTIDNVATLTEMSVSPTDNIALPADGAILTEMIWGILAISLGVGGQPNADAAIIAWLTQVAGQAGITFVDARQTP